MSVKCIPLKPQFYIVKMGFKEVYLFFLFSLCVCVGGGGCLGGCVSVVINHHKMSQFLPDLTIYCKNMFSQAYTRLTNCKL